MCLGPKFMSGDDALESLEVAIMRSWKASLIFVDAPSLTVIDWGEFVSRVVIDESREGREGFEVMEDVPSEDARRV